MLLTTFVSSSAIINSAKVGPKNQSINTPSTCSYIKLLKVNAFLVIQSFKNFFNKYNLRFTTICIFGKNSKTIENRICRINVWFKGCINIWSTICGE